MYAKYVKRMIDVVLSVIALLVLSPLFGMLAIMVKVKLGSPVIFCQPRPGKDGKVFNLYKYRTMNDKRDDRGELLPDEERMTTFGKKLRSSSLDELPELLNIIKGDMSIVGPRPLLVQYLPLYNEKQRHRHDVRPGITGLAQVNGRNSLSWTEKFDLDVEYVKSISFMTDVKIVLKTVKTVLSKQGISSAESVTMEAFKGNE